MKSFIKLILITVITQFSSALVEGQIATRPYYDIYNIKVISSKGGYNLTEGDFNKEVMFGEFVLGRELNYSEKKDARKEAIEFFQENPLQNLQNIAFVTQSMSQIYSLTDALQVALVRNNLIGELYAGYSQSEETSVLYDLIKKYIHIIDFDAINKLVLTEENIEGLMNLYKFSAQVSNMDYNPSFTEIANTKKEIIEIFRSGTIDQKQYLCVTEVYNKLFRANYQNMVAANQEQLLNSYLYQYPDNSTQYNPNQYNDNNTRNTYQMLSNLSLQSHATMMNSIEAIGGSGDYWYIK